MRYELATTSWDDKEVKAIYAVADSGMTTMGDGVARFENEFARYNGAQYGVAVNSGSSANLLMVAALFYRRENALKRGDEVIVPAVSWPTTYYPLHQYGLKLKFVDIDAHTLNYDIEALKKAIGSTTKAIMAVNLLGNPNDFDAINNIIEGKNIILLEDNCESLGADFHGKKTGTFGLMGTYSTFFSHHISTMEGGLILTDDEELYHILLCLRSHGWTRHLPKTNLVCGTKSDDAFTESFRFLLPGYNVRPVEMVGTIGLEQLKKLPDFVRLRRKNGAYFQSLFQDDPTFRIQSEIGASSWFGFALTIRPEAKISREEVIAHLTRHAIECRPIVAGDFTKNEVIQYFDYSLSGEMKNARYLDSHGFFVGNHQFPVKEKIDYLKETLAHLPSMDAPEKRRELAQPFVPKNGEKVNREYHHLSRRTMGDSTR